MEARPGSDASHFPSPSISRSGLRPQLAAGEVGEGRAVGNPMPSNHGRRGAWLLGQRQSLSLGDTERRNLGIRPCGQGGRRNASQVDRVQLKRLHQWSPTRVLILLVCTCFLTGV